MKVNEYYAYTHRKPDEAVFYVGAGTRNRAHSFSHRSDAHKQVVAECGGKRNITVVLTPCDSKELAYATETALIAHYRAVGEPLLNKSSGGGGAAGVTHTAEARAKISAAHTGERHYLYGKHLGDETKAKLSAVHTGKTLSDEHKAKISAATRGTKSGEKHYLYGKHISDATRAKMSAAHKAYWAAKRQAKGETK